MGLIIYPNPDAFEWVLVLVICRHLGIVNDRHIGGATFVITTPLSQGRN